MTPEQRAALMEIRAAAEKFMGAIDALVAVDATLVSTDERLAYVHSLAMVKLIEDIEERSPHD